MSEKASDYFRRLAASLPALEQQIVRDVIAVEAERIHAENFRAEQFTDNPPDKWAARKKSDKNPSRRALLVKTGTLKGHALKGRTRKGAVEFVFPLEYEKVHNEGLKSGRGAGFQMPKRQFVGESKVLTERITKKAKKLFDEHLKKV
jgi:phage gpG-like protein